MRFENMKTLQGASERVLHNVLGTIKHERTFNQFLVCEINCIPQEQQYVLTIQVYR